MKLLYVVSPNSGGVDKTPFMKRAKSLCFNYGIGYEVFLLEGDQAEKRFKEQLHEYQPNRIAAVGGDGTTLFTATQLLNTDYKMGIVPMGSANGMAKELGVASDPMEALKDLLISDQIAEIDLVRINGKHYMLHLGDVGINAQLVKRYENRSGRGMLTYLRCFLQEFFNQREIHAEINAGNQQLNESGVMFALCNGRSYGTGVPLTPYGTPMDGKMELVIFQKATVWNILRGVFTGLSSVFFGTEHRTCMSADRITLRFDQPHLLQLDGEVIEEVGKIEAEMVPKAIRLLSSHKNPYLKFALHSEKQPSSYSA